MTQVISVGAPETSTPLIVREQPDGISPVVHPRPRISRDVPCPTAGQMLKGALAVAAPATAAATAYAGLGMGAAIGLAGATLGTAAAAVTGLLADGFMPFVHRFLDWKFSRAGMVRDRASLPNGEVTYHIGGNEDGRPLVMLHGFGCDGRISWEKQLGLAKDRKLILPDMLWFGESMSDAEDYSVEYQSNTVLQLLDYLDVRDADVVGLSYGGFVALDLAVRNQDRIGRVAVVGCPGHVYTPDDHQELLDRKGLSHVTDLVIPKDPDTTRKFMSLVFNRPPPIPGFVAKEIHAKLFDQCTPQRSGLIHALLDRAGTIDPDTYQLQMPVKIIWGENDDLFPLSLAERLKSRIGDNADVRVIPKANHVPNFEQARLVNDELDQFFVPN